MAQVDVTVNDNFQVMVFDATFNNISVNIDNC